MRSIKIIPDAVSIDGAPLDPDVIEHAHALVVIRDGEEVPGPTDWEISVQTSRVVPISNGVHSLRLDVADGSVLSGSALVRFTDGTRHLFRGDGELEGFVDD